MPKGPTFAQRYRPSIWLITAALIVSATQMRPSLGSLVAIVIQAILLFLARVVVLWEHEE